MSDISALSSSANVLQSQPRENPLPQQTLGSEDFLLLLTKQLSTQDPLKPMEDTQFIAQMASFTSLEQMQSLNDSFASFADLQAMTASQAYLGREVTVAGQEGEVTGVVEAVSQAEDGVILTVNGVTYPSTDVVRVALPSEPETPENTPDPESPQDPSANQ